MIVTIFFEFEFDESLLEVFQDKGFIRSIVIQVVVISFAFDGRDVFGFASIGIGKTAAYLLLALQYLFDFSRKKFGSSRILIFILIRELAMQVFDYVRELAKYTYLDIVIIIGGVVYMNYAEVFSENQDIVVVTIGRLL